jgi:hypothetical protein
MCVIAVVFPRAPDPSILIASPDNARRRPNTVATRSFAQLKLY